MNPEHHKHRNNKNCAQNRQKVNKNAYKNQRFGQPNIFHSNEMRICSHR